MATENLPKCRSLLQLTSRRSMIVPSKRVPELEAILDCLFNSAKLIIPPSSSLRTRRTVEYSSLLYSGSFFVCLRRSNSNLWLMSVYVCGGKYNSEQYCTKNDSACNLPDFERHFRMHHPSISSANVLTVCASVCHGAHRHACFAPLVEANTNQTVLSNSSTSACGGPSVRRRQSVQYCRCS